jgi:hypothetical protein
MNRRGFWPTVDIRQIYSLNRTRIWTIFAGGAPQTWGLIPSNSSPFSPFWSNCFSRLLLIGHPFYFLLTVDACFLHEHILSLVVMVVELPCSEKGHFGLFGLKQA